MTDESGNMGLLAMVGAALGAGWLLLGGGSREEGDEGDEFEPAEADEYDDDAPEGEDEEEEGIDE